MHIHSSMHYIVPLHQHISATVFVASNITIMTLNAKAPTSVDLFKECAIHDWGHGVWLGCKVHSHTGSCHAC